MAEKKKGWIKRDDAKAKPARETAAAEKDAKEAAPKKRHGGMYD